MKKLKFIVLMVFLAGIMLSFSSCFVIHRHDNGKHRGWFKKHDNQNNRGRTVRVGAYDNKNKQPAKKSKQTNKNKWDAKR